MSTVRSEPVKQSAPRRDWALTSAMAALAAVVIIFGGILWVIGGKYTIQGWTDWLTRLSYWIGTDMAVPMPRGWPLIGLIVSIGLLYSLVELLVWRASARRLPLFWIGWAPIVATDIGSTLFGFLSPAQSDPLVLHQLAEAWPLAILATLIITFLPEYMIIGGITLLRRL